MPELKTSRQLLIEQLDWCEGGNGFAGNFAASMIWADRRPKEPRGKDDLKGIVTVYMPHDLYTDWELTQLIEFNKRKTAEYDKICRWRLGANLILFRKEENGRWLRKRLSWESGPMYSPTLADALRTMDKF